MIHMKKHGSKRPVTSTHVIPRYMFSLDNERREAWEAAAKSEGRSLANWVRRVCDAAVARKGSDGSDT